MHEMGIANSIFDIVHRELVSHPQARVRTVGLRIGTFSGVNSDSLMFSFDCLKEGTDLSEAVLAIENADRDELDVTYIEMEEP